MKRQLVLAAGACTSLALFLSGNPEAGATIGVFVLMELMREEAMKP